MPRPKRWLPPVQGSAKVNVDAALSRGGTYGAVAAVCRDQSGIFLEASVVGFRQINDPQTLESLAIREALALRGGVIRSKHSCGLRLQDGGRRYTERYFSFICCGDT